MVRPRVQPARPRPAPHRTDAAVPAANGRGPRCAPWDRRVYVGGGCVLRVRRADGVRRHEHPPRARPRDPWSRRDRSRGGRPRFALRLETPGRPMASRLDGYRRNDLPREASAMRRMSDPQRVHLRWCRNFIAAKTIAVRSERSPGPRHDRAPTRNVNSRREGRRASKRYQRRARTASCAGPRRRGSRGGFIRERSSSSALT